MKWRHVILIVGSAAVCFGGTFTCSTKDDVSVTPAPR
jgi:hypothetical protein